MRGAVGISKKQGDTVSRDVGRDAGLLGKPEHVAVERGIAEFRSGRPAVITRSGVAALALSVDGMTDTRLAAFRHLCAPVEPHLVITDRRAQALGLPSAGATGLAVVGDDAAAIVSLAADPRVERGFEVVQAGPVAEAAIELAKLAQRMPSPDSAGPRSSPLRSRLRPMSRSTAVCRRAL